MLRKSFASAAQGHAKHLLLRRQLQMMTPPSSSLLLSSASVGTFGCGRPSVALSSSSALPDITRRMFSDKQSERLLGHSPMAPGSVGSSQEGARIPTQEEVSIAGGIWNPTSAKRDKISELKVDLLENQYTLDDAATPEQKLDLYLADGLQWIVHTVDQVRLKPPAGPDSLPSVVPETAGGEVTQELPRELDPQQWDMEEALVNVENWINEQETTILQSTIADGQLNQQQWETYLSELSKKLDEVLATLPASRYLRNIRDYYVVPSDTANNVMEELRDELVATEDQAKLVSAGNKALARYRLLMTRAVCEHLQGSWEKLTTLSDEALDRLAVKTDGEEVDGTIPTLPLTKLNHVLRAHLYGNSMDRVDALWDLVDHDSDGLLEKTEMETAAFSAVTPVQSAMFVLFEEALEAQPVRPAPGENADDIKEGAAPVKRGWRQRRKEKKEMKRLTKMFQETVKKHFEDEVEMPHRLRCIYAWAEKAHQDNKLDSVLIEASGWSGRKRYVELQPKISLPEFREVQQIHFTHLDRIGWEIAKSFREDLWVQQDT